MNINRLLERIAVVKEVLIGSGFQRDVREAVTSVASPEVQNNLVALKTIAEGIRAQLQTVFDSTILNDLAVLFPGEEVLRQDEYLLVLAEIINDPSIDTSSFHSKLTTVLNGLNRDLKALTNRIGQLEETLKSFLPAEVIWTDLQPDTAVLSLLFRDIQSTSTLKQFSKTLQKWDRTLQMYHKIISSVPPKDIVLLDVHEGSVDVILNVDLHLAINLQELVLVAINSFAAYLLYKAKFRTPSTAKPLPRVEKLEQQIAEEYLAEIRTSVRNELVSQHKRSKRKDADISEEGIDAKYDDVTLQITNHIINGNEIKLLQTGSGEDLQDPDEQHVLAVKARELRRKTMEVQRYAQELTSDERKLLIAGIRAIDSNK